MKSPKHSTAGFVGDLLAASVLPAVLPAALPAAPPAAASAAAAGEGRGGAPPAAPDPTIRLSSRLTPANNLALERLAYWTPGTGKIQKILNQALAAYFATQPDAQRPTPGE